MYNYTQFTNWINTTKARIATKKDADKYEKKYTELIDFAIKYIENNDNHTSEQLKIYLQKRGELL